MRRVSNVIMCQTNPAIQLCDMVFSTPKRAILIWGAQCPGVECVSTRKDLMTVEERCPERAYVQLTVPPDAGRAGVAAVSFRTVSRDQGWADNKEAAYTWFEVSLTRPGGRSDTGTVRIQHNRVADPEFFEVTTRWDVHDTQSRTKAWLQTLRPGDIIQIIPRACYGGWVNIIQEASIKIEYQPDSTDQSTQAAATLSKPVTNSFYHQLRQDDQQIRLLVVKPGVSDDAIQASFEHASLALSPQKRTNFHALSYCWGDSSEFTDILLEAAGADGESFRISRTVGKVIQRLRSKDTPMRIWIDAICINQNDLEERAQQVSMMGSIYSQAETVHVWLDSSQGIPGIEAALGVVRDIYNCNHRRCPAGDECRCLGTNHAVRVEDLQTEVRKQGYPSFNSMWEIFNHHYQSAFDSDAKEAAGGVGNGHLSYLMQSLFKHPWFQRVWVIQEVILSQRTLIHCGKEMVEWQELLMVNELLDMPGYKDQVPSLRGQLTMPAIWGTLANINDARKQGQDRAADDDNGAAATREENDERKQALTILDVFLTALDLKATDPRDKLFALLAFGQETCEALGVADFTRWWIREYRSLDILSAIHCQPARAWQRVLCDDDPGSRADNTLQRPTWAIGTEGYAKWSRMALLAQFPSYQVASCPMIIPDEDSKEDPLVLRLRGYKIGEIAALGHPPKSMVYPYPGLAQEDANDMRTFFHRMFDPCGYIGVWAHPGTSRDEECTDAAGWRVVYAQHVEAHVGYCQELTGQPATLPTTVRPSGDGYERHQTPKGEELPTCIDNCFFVASKKGLYGLCPWTARKGDVISVLNGGRVPYLLRPAAKGDSGDRDAGGHAKQYELIEECYVHGIMAGETIEGVDTDEIEVFALV
ncbi:putative heterokaryon incompatibility protein [Diplogelasinospora grovesii]|uniref:Heterokaryon incompatibility protein n=1 Tax=Diplogelasinospora grovesii TaxID=303347 RepID=A0AAN6S624_9PEZI|nr:putative heterokaryon incompatibility protein [Diplogelasinospora grovesii]